MILVTNQRPVNITAIQTSSATFTCSAIGPNELYFQWDFDPFFGGTAHTLTTNLKHSISTEESNQNYSSVLTIHNINPVDTGVYTCVVTGGFQVARNSATLNVFGKIMLNTFRIILSTIYKHV